jgi:hypothetical protein
MASHVRIKALDWVREHIGVTRRRFDMRPFKNLFAKVTHARGRQLYAKHLENRASDGRLCELRCLPTTVAERQRDEWLL